MLLQSFSKEIFRAKCNPGFESVHCYAHLDQDVSAALPYLNAALGGFEYLKEPPSVTFRVQGKLLTVHGRMIAVNALKDESEARKIVGWIKREINDVWEKRHAIEPSYKGIPRMGVLDVLRLLPKTNCRECGAPTCLVFATQVAEGAKDASNCPALSDDDRERLRAYLHTFSMDI